MGSTFSKTKNMKSLLLIICLLVLPITGYSSGIASVNFKLIKEDLREYYFSKPGKSEIKEKFETALRQEEQFQEEIQKRIMEGKSLVDLEAVMSMGGGLDRYQLERKIDADLRKELYLIVSEMGLDYELIYDASDSGAIIYAKRPVDDLTTIIRQAIIEHLRKDNPRQSKADAGNGE